MIKLNRNFTPACLNPAAVQEGTDRFINDKNQRVWNKTDLKKALLDLSYEKCAYCECNLTEESKYMEVEHFISKKICPEYVLSWDNLLPSCKRCNITKKDHDVQADPIINPCKDEPKDHLQYRLGRMRGKTKLGRETIEVIGLNDFKRSTLPRHKIAESIMEFVDGCSSTLENHLNSPSTRSRNNLHRKVDSLLQECISSAAYSATAATALHTDPDYRDLRSKLIENSLWKDEFEMMNNDSLSLALEVANSTS